MHLLIPFAIKSLLLAGMALLLLRLFRRRSAAARSVITHCALLALLLVPAAKLVLPPLPITVPGPAANIGTGATIWVALYDATANTAPTAAAETARNIPDWAILAYALPAIGLLLVILLALGRLFALRARADVMVDPAWLNALAQAQRRMGFKHGTALLISDELPSPISWGVARPVIVLNPDALSAPHYAEAIIAHELAHIARRDWAKLLLARVVTALCWFNPLVWMLAREAHQLREESADDAVLAANIADTDYAQLLVGAAGHRRRGLLLAAHAMAPSRKSLARRVRRVLDGTLARGPVAHGFGGGAALVTLVVATPLAAFSLVVTPPADSGSGKSGLVRSAEPKSPHIAIFVKAEADGSCSVTWDQVRMTGKQLYDRAVPWMKSHVKKVGAKGGMSIKDVPDVYLRGEMNTPYRCIGGTIYTMQVAGFPKIGFISLPSRVAEGRIDPAPLPRPSRVNPIHNLVTVGSNGIIRWNGAPIALARLRAYLDQTATMSPEPELRIQPDGDAAYESVDKVLSAVRLAGVTRMGFVGNDRYFRKF